MLFRSALIVWLSENEKLITKERMFEIYLNIIEWGPNVYGVKAASEFYFKKQPSQLSLEEAIFLAHIIPRPKKFYWSIDPNAELKPFVHEFYTKVSERMLKNSDISL